MRLTREIQSILPYVQGRFLPWNWTSSDLAHLKINFEDALQNVENGDHETDVVGLFKTIDRLEMTKYLVFSRAL